MSPQREPRAGSPEALPAVETSNMLKLCAAQIDGALADCDAAIERLLEAFTTIVEDSQWLRRKAEAMASGSQAAAELDMRSLRLATKANAAIQALQFHDRLTQRLGHVKLSLESLGDIVTDPARNARPEEWQELHARLGRLYRTREEVAIFEAVTGSQHAASKAPAPAVSDIELF